jgi:hypothetical protein
MNQKLNCPSCKETILENNYLEKYLSDLNNQEYKLYHCKNCINFRRLV